MIKFKNSPVIGLNDDDDDDDGSVTTEKAKRHGSQLVVHMPSHEGAFNWEPALNKV